jgi:hypothetical protein
VDDLLSVGESAHRCEPGDHAWLTVIKGAKVVNRIPVPCAETYDMVVAPAEAVGGLRRG